MKISDSCYNRDLSVKIAPTLVSFVSPNGTNSSSTKSTTATATVIHTASAKSSNPPTTAVDVGLRFGLGVLPIAGSLGVFFDGMQTGKAIPTTGSRGAYGVENRGYGAGGNIDTRQLILQHNKQGSHNGIFHKQFIETTNRFMRWKHSCIEVLGVEELAYTVLF